MFTLIIGRPVATCTDVFWNVVPRGLSLGPRPVTPPYDLSRQQSGICGALRFAGSATAVTMNLTCVQTLVALGLARCSSGRSLQRLHFRGRQDLAPHLSCR